MYIYIHVYNWVSPVYNFVLFRLLTAEFTMQDRVGSWKAQIDYIFALIRWISHMSLRTGVANKAYFSHRHDSWSYLVNQDL